MLKIRLTRKGKKNNAFFRVVVAEHTAPIKGRFVEVLGFLNPHTKEKSLKVDRIKYWIEKGAQCSDTVHNLLVANGVVNGPKRAVRIKKKAASAEAPAGQAEEATKPEEVKSEGAKSVEASMEASTEASIEVPKEDKAGKPEEKVKVEEKKKNSEEEK